MVFQHAHLFPHLSVRKNLMYGMKRTPVGERNIDLQKLVAALHLEHLLDRNVTKLSGGECQRVALGRAIVRKPKVFLFDEPLANLDAKLRVQMRIEINRLHH